MREGEQCPKCLEFQKLRPFAEPGTMVDLGCGTLGLRCTRCPYAYQGGGQGEMRRETLDTDSSVHMEAMISMLKKIAE